MAEQEKLRDREMESENEQRRERDREREREHHGVKDAHMVHMAVMLKEQQALEEKQRKLLRPW